MAHNEEQRVLKRKTWGRGVVFCAYRCMFRSRLLWISACNGVSPRDHDSLAPSPHATLHLGAVGSLSLALWLSYIFRDSSALDVNPPHNAQPMAGDPRAARSSGAGLRHPKSSLLLVVSGHCPARGIILVFCLRTRDSESQRFKSSPPAACSGAVWFLTTQRSGCFFPHLLWRRYRSLHCWCGVGTSCPCCHTVLASKCFAEF